MSLPPLLVRGMHGLGDNIHQRAVLRALMPRHSITLETSWPCIYHDMPDVRLIRRPVALRTQLKNAEREAGKFAPTKFSQGVHSLQISYNRSLVSNGTILSAMFNKAGIGAEYPNADYRLPVPDEWSFRLFNEVTRTWPHTDKPLLVYRPLTARPEWRGGQVRNANADNYAAIFASIRDNFFVVSVADLEPQREWIVGPQLIPDVTLHKGELTFETLAALFKQAKLAFVSSGFGSILAPAVGTPCISIQGGYEPSSWHADGGKFAPWLGIDPIKPCICATSACTSPCTKQVDVPSAIGRVHEFCSKIHAVSTFAESRPITEMFAPPEHVETIRIPALTLRQKQMAPFMRRAGIKA